MAVCLRAEWAAAEWVAWAEWITKRRPQHLDKTQQQPDSKGSGCFVCKQNQVDRRGVMRLVLFLIIALVIIGVVLFLTRRRDLTVQQRIPAFDPVPNNDKSLWVKGWVEDDLKKILAKFQETYEHGGYSPYQIQLQKSADDRFQLTFPADIHPQLLTFLVNYIHYPFNFDLTDRRILAVAKSTVTAGFEGLDAYCDEQALLYVPKEDKDYDVVYMQTQSGRIFAVSFTDMRWIKKDDARLPSGIGDLIDGA